jgi:3-deoxy-D-manno-octulosonate 8-phosphate phosphatase (KDO 8-P phosphatase)
MNGYIILEDIICGDNLMNKDWVFVLDFDGILTDGKMYYTENGKVMKVVGCDDWELLKELSRHITVNVISADRRGFPITSKRIKEEMNLSLDLVKGNAIQRWDWIKKKYPTQPIIFMGDSLNDYYSLLKADIGITVEDALDFTKKYANVIIKRRGGDRAVAEAILYLNEIYGFFDFLKLLNEHKEELK